MAEKYLEQAVVTLASAFSEGGDAVTSAIPDLSGTLTGLGMQMATLNSSLKLIVDRQRAQEEAANSMRMRIAELETSCSEAHLRLESLTSHKDGLATWSALVPMLEELARRSELRTIEERCNVLDQKVGLTVSKSDIQPFRATVTQQIDAIEKQCAAADDKFSSFAKATTKRLEDLKSIADELIQSQATYQMANENAHTRLKEDINTSHSNVLAQITVVGSTANENLGHTCEEIVKCLAKHSQAIEDINHRETRWQENTANAKEVHALRKEMLSLKRDMEASSFKVHEAYSKCLSIATLAGKGSAEEGLFDKSGSMPYTATASKSRANLSPPRFEAFAAQQESLWFERENKSQAFVAEATRGIAQTLEAQIEVLKQDLLDLRSVQLPSIQTTLSHFRSALESSRQDSHRTGTVMRNLLFVVSEGNPRTFKKLVESLTPVHFSESVSPFDVNSDIFPSRNESHCSSKIPIQMATAADCDLALTILDQFIRSSMDPVLRTLSTTLTQKQAFLQQEAVAAEVEARVLEIRNAMHREKHGPPCADDDDSVDSERIMSMFRLGIEVADSFSAETRFSTLLQDGDSLGPSAKGVDIMAVEKGGVGHRFDLAVGDRIVAVAGIPVKSAVDFVSFLKRCLSDQLSKGIVPAIVSLSVTPKNGKAQREVTIEVGK